MVKHVYPVTVGCELGAEGIQYPSVAIGLAVRGCPVLILYVGYVLAVYVQEKTRTSWYVHSKIAQLCVMLGTLFSLSLVVRVLFHLLVIPSVVDNQLKDNPNPLENSKNRDRRYVLAFLLH
jgi:hypothetical protein